MADLDSGLTDSELVSSVQNAGRMHVTPEQFGAVGDGITDDTVAFQAALDAIPTWTFGATMYGSAGGGGILFLGSPKYLVTNTLYYKSGLIIHGAGAGTHVAFRPATAITMWLTDPDNYGRNDGQEFVEVKNVTFTGNMLVAPFVKCSFIDLIKTHFWTFSRCYFEGFDTVLTSGLSYYHKLDQCEFFNNRLCIDQQQGAQPIVIVGGVMWSYEADWLNYVTDDPINNLLPDEFIKAESSIMLFGASLETRGVVRDPATYASIRCSENGSVSIHGGYTETAYALVEIDMNGYFKNTFIDLSHDYARTMVRLKNFINTGTQESASTNKKSIVTSSISDGTLFPVVNSGLSQGGYLYTGQSTFTWDDTQSVLGSRGVLAANFSSLVDNQWSFRRVLSGDKFEKIRGRTIYCGILLKGINMSNLGLKIQDDPLSSYKFINEPIIDYGDGWGLYVQTYDLSETTGINLNIESMCTPVSDDLSSFAYCGGIFVWVDGYNLFPTSTDDNLRITASAPPSGTEVEDGNWLVGDTIYNDAPIAGGNIGWVCTVAGAGGTWKSFGTIEA